MLDAIGLQVMAHAFAGIAEEMGALLVASSLSPNVRERRDSSAALFTADGALIAQAAHIPVHLGAMPEAVAAIRAERPAPGNTYILNDPYTGGTHLPDVTLVHAVDVAGSVGGYTVVRAHHSDIGGGTPGSMPAGSRELFEEGLVIPPTLWSTREGVRADIERLVLANVRTPDIRRGDLAAQAAACERGADRYRELIARLGRDHVEGAVADLLDYAERRTRESLAAALDDGEYHAEDYLEGDGISEADVVIRARLTMRAGTLHIDFGGTDAEMDGNVNCPFAVARSAALFVLRCLVDQDIPTNGGMHRVITVEAPEGSVINARWPRAVAAGNVETSQRITDVLFGALESAAAVPAQGQGTMNNVVMGGEGWTYYETLGGGQGGSSDGAGPSGVHVGMSNTRNTPVEVLELEYPLRIEEYSLRSGSGGHGEHAGGEGVIRAYRALGAVHASLITERRRHRPRGARGGEDAAPGRNTLNGVPLGGRATLRLTSGDLLVVETPGGGGWGTAQPDSLARS